MTLALGTECSGICAPSVALSLLGVGVDYRFACEYDPHCRKQLVHHYKPKTLYDNMTTVNNFIDDPSFSSSRRDQKRATQKTGGATPLHTSTPSPRARRRDRPEPRVHALFKRTARRPHIIPQSEPTTSSTKKEHSTRKNRANKDH